MILYIKDDSKGVPTRRRLVKKGIVALKVEWRESYYGTILVDDLRPEPVGTTRLRTFPGREVYVDFSDADLIFDPKVDPFILKADPLVTYHLIPNHDEESVELHVDA